MAGQGLNLGIADADALARVIQEGKLSGTDVGSKTLLSLYERERKVILIVWRIELRIRCDGCGTLTYMGKYECQICFFGCFVVFCWGGGG